MRSHATIPLSRLLRWFAGAAVALAAHAAGAEARGAPELLTVAVVPNQPALVLHRAWTPFVEELSRRAGVPLRVKLYERLPAFLEEVEAGVPDLVYAAPNMFYAGHRAQGYEALVRGGRTLSGVILVRRDSPYHAIADLEGKAIAFVGPKNLCAVLTRHALATSGQEIHYDATFGGSAVNVGKMVAMGKVDAGAMLDASLVRDAPDLAALLRPILQTPSFPSHPIAAHPRVATDVRARITAAVLALGESDEGRALLSAVKLANPVLAETERDYSIFGEMPATRDRREGP